VTKERVRLRIGNMGNAVLMTGQGARNAHGRRLRERESSPATRIKRPPCTLCQWSALTEAARTFTAARTAV